MVNNRLVTTCFLFDNDSEQHVTTVTCLSNDGEQLLQLSEQ